MDPSTITADGWQDRGDASREPVALPGQVDAGRGAGARPTIDDLGIDGDRQWALVDLGTGLALTARRVPELLFAQARLVGETDVEIELPDGTVTTDDAALSAWLGRDVELRRAGGGVTGRYEIAADFEDEAGSPWFQWDGPDGTFHDSGKHAGLGPRHRLDRRRGTAAASAATCSSRPTASATSRRSSATASRSARSCSTSSSRSTAA